MKINLYLLFVFVFSANILYAQISPITADSYTVLLDHFDNSTIGDPKGGALTYVASQNGLYSALDFSNGGSYVVYTETVNISAKGTVEMWIKLPVYNKGILNVNWFNSTSSPSSGHVFHLRTDETGKVSLSGWGNPANSFLSNSSIPLNTWTHLAVSWGDSTKIYINGKLDLVSELWFRPAIYLTKNYFYLPYWGENCGLIDELHVSSIQRTNAEIASRVIDHTPTVKETVYHQTIITSGGNINGSDGSVAYSLGQMVFNHYISNSGSILEGLQQPLEIYFTGFNQPQLQVETLVYPNPADDYIILKIKQEVLLQNLQYDFYDINGRLLQNGLIKDEQTVVQLQNLPPSSYLLKISNKKSQSKTYKIIKK